MANKPALNKSQDAGSGTGTSKLNSSESKLGEFVKARPDTRSDGACDVEFEALPRQKAEGKAGGIKALY